MRDSKRFLIGVNRVELHTVMMHFFNLCAKIQAECAILVKI